MINDLDDQAHARDLIAAYVLDAATPAETTLVKEHLASCSLCRRLESELRDVVLTFPSLVAARTPPAHLKDRVLKATASEPRVVIPYQPSAASPRGDASQTATVQSWLNATKSVETKKRSTARPAVLLAAVVACALAALTLWFFLVRVPLTPPSTTYRVAGQAMHSITGSLTYTSSSSQVALALAGLDPQDKRHVYELWLIHGKKVTLVKAFSPSADGSAQLTFAASKDFTSNDLAAITVERAPSSQTPHLPLVAKAKIRA